MIRVLSKIDYQKLIWKLINFSDVNWGGGGGGNCNYLYF